MKGTEAAALQHASVPRAVRGAAGVTPLRMTFFEQPGLSLQGRHGLAFPMAKATLLGNYNRLRPVTQRMPPVACGCTWAQPGVRHNKRIRPSWRVSPGRRIWCTAAVGHRRRETSGANVYVPASTSLADSRITALRPPRRWLDSERLPQRYNESMSPV